jgi:hypothetical protein
MTAAGTFSLDTNTYGTLTSVTATAPVVATTSGSTVDISLIGPFTVATLPAGVPDGTTATVTDNIRGVWKYVASSGQWHSVTGVANINDWGADPSGSTYSTSAIQAASDAMRALASGVGDGPVLYFPTGNYKVSGSITLYANVHYRGNSGGGSQVWLAPGSVSTPTSIFTYVLPGNPEVDLVDIRDIGIDGNNANNSGAVTCAYLNNVSGGEVKDVVLNNCTKSVAGDSLRGFKFDHILAQQVSNGETGTSGVNTNTEGIYLTAAITGANEAVEVSGASIFENILQPFHLENCTNCTIKGNYIEGPEGQTVGAAPAVQIINTSYGGEVSNNRITGYYQPFQLGPNFDAFSFRGNYTARTSGPYAAVIQTTGTSGWVEIGSNAFDQPIYTNGGTLGAVSKPYIPSVANLLAGDGGGGMLDGGFPPGSVILRDGSVQFTAPVPAAHGIRIGIGGTVAGEEFDPQTTGQTVFIQQMLAILRVGALDKELCQPPSPVVYFLWMPLGIFTLVVQCQ